MLENGQVVLCIVFKETFSFQFTHQHMIYLFFFQDYTEIIIAEWKEGNIIQNKDKCMNAFNKFNTLLNNLVFVWDLKGKFYFIVCL